MASAFCRSLTIPLQRTMTVRLLNPVRSAGVVPEKPVAPAGYQLFKATDGKYLKGADGAYLYGRVA